MSKHSISWFEIPVLDFEQAKQFYSTIFDYEMQEMKLQNLKMGMLPMDDPMSQDSVGGAIVKGESYVPQTEGVLVYLAAGEDLNVVLNKVNAAGGKVLMEKTQITEEIGYMALFLDTEGNRIALHSPK